jgi:DNA-binding winged helix-turn-helix (wHTH) protein
MVDQSHASTPFQGNRCHNYALSFGPFQLVPTQRLLLEAGEPLHIGSRALDILIALAERPGEVVRKDELMDRVWPNTFVGDGNLKVHVAALRRVLGDGRNGQRYVINVHGRGYVLVAQIRREEYQSLQPVTATERAQYFTRSGRLEYSAQELVVCPSSHG